MNVYQVTLWHDFCPIAWKIIAARNEAKARRKFNRILKRLTVLPSIVDEITVELI